MFIVGKDKLEKKNECKDIIFVKKFDQINIYFLKNIKPIFQFNKNIAKNFDIKINNKKINM